VPSIDQAAIPQGFRQGDRPSAFPIRLEGRWAYRCDSTIDSPFGSDRFRSGTGSCLSAIVTGARRNEIISNETGRICDPFGLPFFILILISPHRGKIQEINCDKSSAV